MARRPAARWPSGRRREAQVAVRRPGGACTAQAAAMAPPHFVPSTPEEPYRPPSQLSVTNVWSDAQLLGAVDDHRRALGRVAELVQVDGDRRHAVDPEVPRWDGVAEQLQVGERDPAHARVDVAADAALGGIAATSSIGSITPCGYCGAEPRPAPWSASTAAPSRRRRRASRRRRAPARLSRRSSRAPFSNAACALAGSTMFGRVMPRSAPARSRAALTAISRLSVPPVVRNPAASGPPWTSPAPCRRRRTAAPAGWGRRRCSARCRP